MPSSTKCLYKEGGSADEANANDSILVTRTSANATVRGTHWLAFGLTIEAAIVFEIRVVKVSSAVIEKCAGSKDGSLVNCSMTVRCASFMLHEV